MFWMKENGKSFYFITGESVITIISKEVTGGDDSKNMDVVKQDDLKEFDDIKEAFKNSLQRDNF